MNQTLGNLGGEQGWVKGVNKSKYFPYLCLFDLEERAVVFIH